MTSDLQTRPIDLLAKYQAVAATGAQPVRAAENADRAAIVKGFRATNVNDHAEVRTCSGTAVVFVVRPRSELAGTG